MRNKIYMSGILFLLIMMSGCIKDGLKECPESDITIRLYAERFQNSSENPLDDIENVFTERVTHLRYYLYKDGQMVGEKILPDLLTFRNTSNKAYTLGFDALEYGNYELVVVGNCTKNGLSGNPARINNLLLTYAGCANTEDYFTAVFPFTVNSNDPATYDVGLSRVHGVILYRFVNLPENITAVGVSMENVSNEKWIYGSYANRARAEQQYSVIHPTSEVGKPVGSDDFVMGTFPTLSGEKSAYHLSLFREDELLPYSTLLISDTLNVRRNQLLEVIATFRSEYEVDFEINLDTRWDGFNSGGISIQ